MVANDRKQLTLTWGVVALVAGGIRLLLVSVNRWANDYHIEVVDWMEARGLTPSAGDCWSCYHAKAYHHTLLWLFSNLGLHDVSARIVAGQCVNLVAGLLTILILLRFIARRYSLNSFEFAALASVVALCPALLAPHVQATNDAFAALFSTAMLIWVIQWFDGGSPVSLLIAVGNGALALLSKGTTLPVVLGCVGFSGVVFLTALRQHKGFNSRAALLAAAIAAIAVPTAYMIGPYRSHYRLYGNPLVTNFSTEVTHTSPPPPPAFLEKSEVGYPGIRAIADGYLTFRLVDLLSSPSSPRSATEYPEHRTSFWTRLYALTNSISFDQWPPAWRSEPDAVHGIRRLSFMAALPALVMVIAGFFYGIKETIRGLVMKTNEPFDTPLVLATSIAACLLLPQLYFTYVWRSFDFIKALYITPGALAFVTLLCSGYESFRRRTPPIGIAAINVALCVLALAYLADELFLAAHLATVDYPIPY